MKKRDIRRLAMQLLYQADLNGSADREAMLADLEGGFDPPQVAQPAVELALAAWDRRDQADRAVAQLAPAWPTHRQPPVDRALLRLAYYEMVSGITPPKVAINEAIELAKKYASEQSPPFLNGVLDKLARELKQAGQLPEADASDPPSSWADPWLRDALDE